MERRSASFNMAFKTRRKSVYSKSHPMIPKDYVPGWKKDMENRQLILENAYQGSIPNYEHDDSLYLEGREQLSYNVEDRSRVEARYHLPPREELMKPPIHQQTSKYQSTLAHRK